MSANANELKACVGRSSDLLKPFPEDMNKLMEKFISMCTDGASTNIGCNDSLLTLLLEEYPHLVSFWCICHKLELAFKDSIGDGFLLKLYYLYNKSLKKLRSLKEIISKLECLIYLNDNFTDDDGIAPIKSCGTRWIGHLVNALQRAINKFGIYLKDFENLANGEKKSSAKARLFGYINKWKDYRYLLGMGFILHLLMPLKELSLGWQKNFVSAVDKEQRLEKSLSNILMLKSICEKGKELELPYVKTILDNTHDDCYQSFHFNNVERAKTTISNNAIIWCDNVNV